MFFLVKHRLGGGKWLENNYWKKYFGLEEPTEGQMIYNGKDITKMNV